MKNQTAVEWLVEQLIINKIVDIKNGHQFIHLQSTAKEMEEQYIINAFDAGHRSGAWNFLGEEYYEETFKKENNVR